MTELFDFLNQQSGDRLFWYGFVFLVSVYFITEALVLIFKSIFKK